MNGVSMPRDFAARIDSNHRVIVEYLQAHGYVVVESYRQGDGCPDCFVLSKSSPPRWVAFEIKTKAGKLSPLEADLFDRCGVGAPLFTVTTPEDAVEIMVGYDCQDKISMQYGDDMYIG